MDGSWGGGGCALLCNMSMFMHADSIQGYHSSEVDHQIAN